MHFSVKSTLDSRKCVFNAFRGKSRWVRLSFENNNNNNTNNNNTNNNNNNNNYIMIIIIIKDIAPINFTLRYLQLYLLFSCIAGARFCLFPGRKILVLLHQFGQHIME